MASTSRRTAELRIVTACFAAVVAIALAGCGSHHQAGRSAPTTTLLTADRWTPPSVAGPPGAAKFCALLVADYQHLAQLNAAATLHVREEIVHDAVGFAPTVIAAAPANIASQAARYLGSMAQVMGALDAAGLDARHLRSNVGGLLFDPKVQAAGSQVIAYASQQCHYQIGGSAQP